MPITLNKQESFLRLMKVVYWKNDPAATNIVEHLKELGLEDLIISSEKSLLFIENIEADADFFVVASIHKSESRKPTLTAHASGNWGPAELGGNPHELSYTWPAAIKVGLESLAKANLEGYEVSAETSHHGPTTWSKPLIFIEIGSTEEQWNNPKAGKVVAEAIKDIYENNREFENYVGFGGIHYAPSFTKILLEKDIAIGHIAPKYASEHLDKEIIKEALEKSFAEKVLIDWKGIKSEARHIVISALDELGIEWKKTKDF